ncbi:MAG: hypothetical protein K8S56_06475 [Candidatus Cloacimonetes bacterium]|nr:hypothetical protein [Candidatus Cloacimonadota bacterium]
MKPLLTQEEQQRITKAVTKAENGTSGEVTVAIIRESSDYAAHELLFAIIGGMIISLVMLLFTQPIEIWLQTKLWRYSSGYLVLFYIAIHFAAVLVLYLLANLPVIDRLIIGRATMSKKVNQRAFRHFVESGTHTTRDNTGILIFISILERRVELLADTGINSKIAPEEWQSIVTNIIDGIHQKHFVEKLEVSIGKCGELLRQHFPADESNPNELNDAVTMLEER